MATLIKKIFGKKEEYVRFSHLGTYRVDDLVFWGESYSGARLFVTPDGHMVSDNSNADFEIFFA